MDKSIQANKIKKCLSQDHYRIQLWRHVDDSGVEEGDFYIGTYDGAKHYFQSRYGEEGYDTFFVDTKGYLY